MEKGKHTYKANVIGKGRNGLVKTTSVSPIYADTEAAARSNARARVERTSRDFKITAIEITRVK